MAISVRRFWHRAAMTTYVVEMGITTNGAGSINNIIGVWDATALAYYFDFPDTTAATVYDEAKSYSIWENGSLVLTEISLGATQTAIGHAAHVADTAAHGASGGAVVGTTLVQTLTNKTIKHTGTGNVLEIAPSDLLSSADSNLLGQKIKPAADDTVLHLDENTGATSFTIQAANAAKSASRVMKLKGTKVTLSDHSGAAIKLDGLAAATGNGEAIRYDEFHAVDVRVATLEVGTAWAVGGPTVSLSLRQMGRLRVARFVLDAGNAACVRRWEIFVSTGTLGGLAAGIRSSAEVAHLETLVAPIRVRAGEGNSVTLFFEPGDTIYAIAVAFDSTGVAYSSVEHSNVGTGVDEGGGLRLAAGNLVEIAGTMGGDMAIATSADDNAAAAVVTWCQTNVSMVVKARQPYTHEAVTKKLRLTYYARADTSAHVGYGKIAVALPGGADVISAQFSIPYAASMPSTPTTLDFDVSSGLTAGVLYDVTVSIAADAATVVKTEMNSNILVKPIQQVPVY